MFCWNCGARNPDENSFCGRCGKRIASAKSESDSLRTSAPIEFPAEIPSVANAAPLQSNPLIEEPRAIHDTPRKLVPAEVAVEPPGEDIFTPPPMPENPLDERPFAQILIPEQPRKEKSLDEHFIPDEPRGGSHRLPPNRITGPSFLGLSDESTSDSNYLLEDDEPQRSSWRGWLALAVLALLGFLIYKQWNAVQAAAHAVAERATTSSNHQKAGTPPAPAPSNVSN
jgi:hypothetical protein